MTLEDRIKVQLGELLFNMLVNGDAIEQKDAQIADLKSKLPPPEPKPGDA